MPVEVGTGSGAPNDGAALNFEYYINWIKCRQLPGGLTRITMMQIYNFFRRGTSHRLHIALSLKGIEADHVAVDLCTEQASCVPARRARLPARR
jgi:hypothetical protein